MRRLMTTAAPAATILVRFLVGFVFLAEGVGKFLYPAELAAGRFAKIGIPHPDIMGPFVGVVEVGCGALLLVGLLTRPAALMLFVNISVALVSTKIPVLLGQGFWGFALKPIAALDTKQYGFFSAVHEARTDLCMWLGGLFLMIVGAGWLSVDALLTRRPSRGEGPHIELEKKIIEM